MRKVLLWILKTWFAYETWVGQILRFMRAGISFCVVVVVVEGEVFFRKCSLSVMEVVCSGVGFWLVEGGIFKLGGSFVVVVEVENEEFESVVECVMGPVFLVVLLVAFESDVGGT